MNTLSWNFFFESEREATENVHVKELLNESQGFVNLKSFT